MSTRKELRRWWLLFKWMFVAFLPSSIEAEWFSSVSPTNGDDAEFWASLAIFMVINMIVIALGFAVFASHLEQDKEEEEKEEEGRGGRSKMQ